MEYIAVGEIIKAQGIAGEVKIKPLTANAERFKKLRILYVKEKPYKVLSVRTDTYAYVKLQGVDDRNAAESLRGQLVQIDRINAVDLEDDEYFIADLIGCAIVTEKGDTLGKITDVSQIGGTADVIEARDEKGKGFRFPFLNRIVQGVHPEQKRFVVYSDLLQEVCVYDD